MSKGYTDAMRANDYKVVFGSPVGRKVLTDIMVKGKVFGPINSADPQEAARLEGMRQMALHIASFIRFDADAFIDAWKQPDET